MYIYIYICVCVTFALFGDGKAATICGTWYASEIVKKLGFFW